MESILLKHYDEILQLPLHLCTLIMEGRVKIVETYLKSEELLSPICMHLQALYSTSDYVEQNCHVLVHDTL